MTDRSPEALLLAQRLFLHEVGVLGAPVALAEAAERVNARLRGHLARLIGRTGYTVLVARAVRLAQAEVPALEAYITVNTLDTGADGGLRGVHDFVLAHDGEQGVAEAGLIVMLGTIIELLSTFIGEDLAFSLVRNAWPELVDDQADRQRRKGQP
jgi:hypothetical protein